MRMKVKNPVITARKILKHFSGLDSTLIMAELIRIYKVQMDKHPLPDRVSGMLWFDQGQPIIVTNENHPYVRRRFTAFHELGHLILGHRGVRLCVDLFGSDKLLERHANQFAAEILMPRGIINWYLRRGANIKRIAQELCVSEEAVAYRIRDLTI
jgi:Zn-dependent peptidase ImmA (M78 family)